MRDDIDEVEEAVLVGWHLILEDTHLLLNGSGSPESLILVLLKLGQLLANLLVALGSTRYLLQQRIASLAIIGRIADDLITNGHLLKPVTKEKHVFCHFNDRVIRHNSITLCNLPHCLHAYLTELFCFFVHEIIL